MTDNTHAASIPRPAEGTTETAPSLGLLSQLTADSLATAPTVVGPLPLPPAFGDPEISAAVAVTGDRDED
ncbi:hypothetical protein ACPA54_09325 [Uniformispora flossi]|uniref:hypothetical protein n=1 Tax=Uniformispora flossi TaxID=3390723 RepID=UPI003C2B91B7